MRKICWFNLIITLKYSTMSHSHFVSFFSKSSCNYFIFLWHGGVMLMAFETVAIHFRVTTGQIDHMHVPLSPSSIVQYWPICGWEGNRGPGSLPNGLWLSLTGWLPGVVDQIQLWLQCLYQVSWLSFDLSWLSLLLQHKAPNASNRR